MCSTKISKAWSLYILFRYFQRRETGLIFWSVFLSVLSCWLWEVSNYIANSIRSSLAHHPSYKNRCHVLKEHISLLRAGFTSSPKTPVCKSCNLSNFSLLDLLVTNGGSRLTISPDRRSEIISALSSSTYFEAVLPKALWSTEYFAVHVLSLTPRVHLFG